MHSLHHASKETYSITQKCVWGVNTLLKCDVYYNNMGETTSEVVQFRLVYINFKAMM